MRSHFGLLSLAISWSAAWVLSAAAAGAADAQGQAQDCRLTRFTSIETVPTRAGGMLVPVTIGDVPKLLLFDTGGVITDITQPAAKELNLPVFESGLKLVGVGGETSTHYAVLPSLGFGGSVLKSVKVMISPGSGPLDPNDDRIAGTLVLTAQGKFDIDLDFVNHRMNFFSVDHCPGKVVYWPATAVAVVPMRVADSGHIVIRVMLDGVPMNALVDTGTYNTTLNLNTAKSEYDIDFDSPDVQPVGVLGGDGNAKIYRRRFKTLALEGVVVNDPMITLMPDKMKEQMPNGPKLGSLIHEDDPDKRLPDLILGTSILAKMHVYIASQERKLYMTMAAPPP
jgi:hypothetical protein